MPPLLTPPHRLLPPTLQANALQAHLVGVVRGGLEGAAVDAEPQAAAGAEGGGAALLAAPGD